MAPVRKTTRSFKQAREEVEGPLPAGALLEDGGDEELGHAGPPECDLARRNWLVALLWRVNRQSATIGLRIEVVRRMQHVEREVQLPSPPAEVWQAVIDPVRLGDWLGGDLDVSLRPGGRGAFRSPDGVGPTRDGAPRRGRRRALVLVVARDRCGRGEHGHDHGCRRRHGGSTVRVHETAGRGHARDRMSSPASSGPAHVSERPRAGYPGSSERR